MKYSLEEKHRLIIEDLLKQESSNPLEIVNLIMKNDYINIHGPEHHLLDGGAFLIASKNSGLEIDIAKALHELSSRSIKMPGGMCGSWGVCGASTSIGAALSIIGNTNSLVDSEEYKNNMEFTSSVISAMSKIGGPRCCKRNAYLSISMGVKFVNHKYNLYLESKKISCEFSDNNAQCIKDRCPFWRLK